MMQLRARRSEYDALQRHLEIVDVQQNVGGVENVPRLVFLPVIGGSDRSGPERSGT